MNKFLISFAIGGLTLSANIWAGAARAAWFTEYSCDYSNVTLREVGKGNYRYEAARWAIYYYQMADALWEINLGFILLVMAIRFIKWKTFGVLAEKNRYPHI